ATHPAPEGDTPMAVPTTTPEFLALVRDSGLLDGPALDRLRAGADPAAGPRGCADALVRAGALTPFQAGHLLAGRCRGLVLGHYKLLRVLGRGGMGAVYLAEHALMRRLVAVKVLPQARARDRLALGRFYREARAAAALDHPNIVRVD